MIRLFDFTFSLILLIITLPIICVFALLIFFQDFKSPFYISKRFGLKGKPFRMIKLRTMKVCPNNEKIDTTSANDPRLTFFGKIIRSSKVDELPQFINVLIGNMSLVGPRPNIEREINLYTKEEKKLFLVKPGITDISSIVFSDLAEIVKEYPDPNIAYAQLVRPWKSRLGLLYAKKKNFIINLQIICFTLIAFCSRQRALIGLSVIVKKMGGDEALQKICLRANKLTPTLVPGADRIIISR